MAESQRISRATRTCLHYVSLGAKTCLAPSSVRLVVGHLFDAAARCEATDVKLRRAAFAEPAITKVAIVGGGPSGLATLKYLWEAQQPLGCEPAEAVLFEYQNDVGGTNRREVVVQDHHRDLRYHVYCLHRRRRSAFVSAAKKSLPGGR
ncbi:hypothetical protein BM221_009000 [Beauveria bassiana]|uniref:Uncharacterized protein n=1 Tax=Beauveria bassiana TaxID=176275 RepID=A0A2N6NEE4_BEABA|nr:hypothetical protein BM221_010770 [Beauveria bassiana]PMB65639.1 hypothetical protein BM221_009000 [Beauveria bassiana]